MRGLILTRRREESFQIGDAILVKVVRIRDGNVRIAIQAPKGVRILRTEIIPENERIPEKCPR